MKKIHNVHIAVSLLTISLTAAAIAFAASPAKVNLGKADSFAILAGSTITNIGSSVVNGDLGLFPGTAVTGFPPATLNGTQHIADALANQAKTALTDTYTDASNRTPVTTIGTELGGTTQIPGVYTSNAGTFGLTGTLTLDAQGDPNAVFIFKSASTLITASNSNIVLAGGAQACNIFWLVGSSATLGANSTLEGSIMALTSITLNTGAHVDGRVMAQNGAVTLDSSTVIKPSCAVAPTPTPVVVVVTSTTTPVVITVITTPTQTQASTSTPIVSPVVIATSPGIPNTGYGDTGVLPLSMTVISALSLLTLAASYRRKSSII